MPEKFEVIIVGAGPAGSTAALALAQAGLKVAVFERGEQPGSKNMFGGMLYYTEVIDRILPDFWTEAPIERYITTHVLVFTSKDSSVSISFSDKQFGQLPYNAVTLLRAKFDQWLAGKAQEAGALLIPETLIEELVYDGKRVVGVRAARDEGLVYADVVIIAEGANSLLVESAGLTGAPSTDDFAVAAKEILTMPAKVIEERFNLKGREGASYSSIGDSIQGVEGGGFLFTNRTSLSIGVVAKLSSLQKRQVSIAELMETFKNHTSIRPLIEGAHLKEYSGHLIPEGGLKSMPDLYGDGLLVVGDAARLICSTGLTLQGMNFAMASGLSAAEAVGKARESNDFSKKGLSHYKKGLEQSFVLPSLNTFRHAPGFLSTQRIYTVYPSIFCGFMRRIFKAGDHPRKKFLGLLRMELKENLSLWQLIKDIWKGWRALLW